MQSKGFKSTIKPLGGKGAPPIELNTGDEELAPFIDPLLQQNSVSIANLVDDAGKRAQFDFVVRTAGMKVWGLANSD